MSSQIRTVSPAELPYNARAPMSLFRYGRDFYTDEAAQHVLSAGAWLLVALVGIANGVHLLRLGDKSAFTRRA